MSSIQPIQAFKTRGGKVFELEADAKAHEAELLFDDFYEDNYLLGNYKGSRVLLCDIKDWLRENKAMVLAFLGAEGQE